MLKQTVKFLNKVRIAVTVFKRKLKEKIDPIHLKMNCKVEHLS